jgi:mannose-6-phosphate isomerase
VWGVLDLRPWINRHGLEAPVGEAWFQSPSLPLMKWIFTTERLSVQVHPEDGYAMQHHGSPGKTEAWYVVHAKPGATLGLGLRRELTRDQARAAALDGSIGELLNWVPVQPGDTVFIPAGTIHAIGAGLVVAEIQQDSDITYRLYDYGRGRELHLDRGLDVADLRPWSGEIRSQRTVLAECPYFRLELNAGGTETVAGPYPAPAWVIFPSGAGSIHGLPWRQGDVWLLDAGETATISAPGISFLTGYIPD